MKIELVDSYFLEQLADAYMAIARADHYMVGITEPVSDDEVDEAYKILIRRQNAFIDAHPNAYLNSKRYVLFERALDLIEARQRHRAIAASRGITA